MQSKMPNEGPLNQFRNIKDVVSHYDAIFASIKSPQTVYNEGLAIIRDRVAEMWASIAAADPDEREKLQENLLELGGQKKELEINYKANIKRWEVLYETRLRETMDQFRGQLAQLVASTTARAQSQPQPQPQNLSQIQIQIQLKTQPQSQSQPPSQPPSQPRPQPQLQAGPQIILDHDPARETIENRQTENEPVKINLIEDDPKDDPKDDGPGFESSVEEPADKVRAENDIVETDSTEKDATEDVPIKEEPIQNDKLGNLATVESSRDRDIEAPSSPLCDTITVGTSTMVGPPPKVENTCMMSTRAREIRNKRRAVSPAPITNKRRKRNRAASAVSIPDSESGTPAEDSRRPTRQSHRHNQSTGVQEFEGITDPEPGRIYLTFWTKTKEWLAVLLLPMGDFNSVGIPGSIISCGLSESLPSCYRFNKRTKKYTWVRDYQDGMPLVNKRMFPVMYFDGREFPHKSAIMWIEAKDLRKFHPKRGSSLVPNMKIILKYLEEHGGKASSHGIEVDEDVEVIRSERLGSQLPDIAEQEDLNNPETTTAGPSNAEPQTQPTNAGINRQESAPLEELEALAPKAELSVKIQRMSSTRARTLSHPRLSAIVSRPFPMPSPPATPGLSRSQRRRGQVDKRKEKPVIIDISDDESEFNWDDSKDDVDIGLTQDDAIRAPSESPAQDTRGPDTSVQHQAQYEKSTVESQPAVITNQPTSEDEARATAERIAQAALDHEAPCQDRGSHQTGNIDERAPQRRNSYIIGHLYLRSPSATNTSKSDQDYGHIHSQTRATSDSRPMSAPFQTSSGNAHPQSQFNHYQQPQNQEQTPPHNPQPSGPHIHSVFLPIDSRSIRPGRSAPAPEPAQGQEESYQVPVNKINALQRRWELQNQGLAVDRLHASSQQTYQQPTSTEHQDTQEHPHQARDPVQQLASDCHWTRHPHVQRAERAPQHRPNQQVPQPNQRRNQQLLAQQAQLYLQAQADKPSFNAQHPVQEESSQPSHESSQRPYFNHTENHMSNQTARYPPPSSHLVLSSNTPQIMQTQPPNQEEQTSSDQVQERFDQSYNPYSSIRCLSKYQDLQHAPVERRFQAQAAQQTSNQTRDMRNTQAIAAVAYQGLRPPAYQPTSQHRQTRQYIQLPDDSGNRI